MLNIVQRIVTHLAGDTRLPRPGFLRLTPPAGAVLLFISSSVNPLPLFLLDAVLPLAPLPQGRVVARWGEPTFGFGLEHVVSLVVLVGVGIVVENPSGDKLVAGHGSLLYGRRGMQSY